MIRIGLMANTIFSPNRRELLGKMSALALGPILSQMALAQALPSLRLKAKPTTLPLRSGASTAIWALERPAASPVLKPGGKLTVFFQNALPVPTALDWRGMDGASGAEPLISYAPVAPGAEAAFALPLRRPGTFSCDVRLLGDGQSQPSRPLPIVVQESESIAIAKDEVFLVEDWRTRPDGGAFTPGSEANEARPLYTVNGQVLPDISLRSREPVKLRVINGCQREVIAVRMEGCEVRVIALDSAAAEPFLARNSVLVLPPGGRIDALITVAAAPGAALPVLLHDGKDARNLARFIISKEPPLAPAPLPAAPAPSSDGLPVRLELRGALRVDLALSGGEWLRPADFSSSAVPAFRANAGRTVVLALTNHAVVATAFHLHGHHFRLLDRLDDGWKPFWLDTLAIEPGQRQRIAFAAEFSGRWLLESTRADWTAPKLVQWYSIE